MLLPQFVKCCAAQKFVFCCTSTSFSFFFPTSRLQPRAHSSAETTQYPPETLQQVQSSYGPIWIRPRTSGREESSYRHSVRGSSFRDCQHCGQQLESFCHQQQTRSSERSKKECGFFPLFKDIETTFTTVDELIEHHHQQEPFPQVDPSLG